MDSRKEAKKLKRAEKQGDVTESVQIPIGKASVKQMIDAGFYADQTSYITKLFKDEGTLLLLYIRPRRFGKSLLLDTIDQMLFVERFVGNSTFIFYRKRVESI